MRSLPIPIIKFCMPRSVVFTPFLSITNLFSKGYKEATINFVMPWLTDVKSLCVYGVAPKNNSRLRLSLDLYQTEFFFFALVVLPSDAPFLKLCPNALNEGWQWMSKMSLAMVNYFYWLDVWRWAFCSLLFLKQ